MKKILFTIFLLFLGFLAGAIVSFNSIKVTDLNNNLVTIKCLNCYITYYLEK